MSDDRRSDGDELDRRIADAKAGQRGASGVAVAAPAKGYAQGSRVLAELLGAPLGGALIGRLLDRWLGTSPWLLLILLTLSIVVAFRNIFRISKESAE